MPPLHFLVQSPHAWQGIRQRPHHLMQRFASAGHHVTWVQPRYLSWLLKDRNRYEVARPARPVPELEVRTVTLWNGERFAPVRNRNQRALRAAFEPPRPEMRRVLWLYNPHEVHLSASVPHDLLIYDIMDEYRGFAWSPPQIAAEEAELLRRADWVFAGTHQLFDAKRDQAPDKIECILSGVELELFAPDAARPFAPPANLSFDQPILGYAGMLDDRLDVELLTTIATRFPVQLVLLGPHAAQLSALKNLPNVHAPGAVPYATLPAWYAHFTLALLPFVENELTRHINPTKMLEYAAAGCPILARALPEVRRCYADGAFLYATHNECLTLLEKLLADAALRGSRRHHARAWARERDWDALATRMLKRVEDLLALK